MYHGKERLPQDLITIEILPRINSIKSLIRFKSVSKSWNSIISSNPNFAKQHLQFQIQNNKDYHLIHYYNTSHPTLHSLKDDPSQFPEITNYWDDSDDKYLISRRRNLVGSVNGLVCFYEPLTNAYTLWNPATRSIRRILEPWDFASFHDFVICYGFGYSPSCDDYKIVFLFVSRNHRRVYIFSTRAGCWRHVEIDNPSVNLSVNPSVQIGENLHWILNSTILNPHPVILALDLTNDSINTVPLPVNDQDLKSCTVSKIRGRLCVAWCRVDGDPGVVVLEVWMLDVYGEPETWKLIFTHTGLDYKCFTLHSVLEVKDDIGRIFVIVSDPEGWYEYVVFDSTLPLECLEESLIHYSKVRRVDDAMFRTVECIESFVSPFTSAKLQGDEDEDVFRPHL